MKFILNEFLNIRYTCIPLNLHKDTHLASTDVPKASKDITANGSFAENEFKANELDPDPATMIMYSQL